MNVRTPWFARLAALSLLAWGPLACGTQATGLHAGAAVPAIQAHLQQGEDTGLHAAGTPHHLATPASDDCADIREDLAAKLDDLEDSEAFQEMAQTKQYQRLTRTLERLQRKKCDLNNRIKGSATCAELRVELQKRQIALLRSPQFKAMARTSEFREFIAGYRQAVMEGCLATESSRLLQDLFGSDSHTLQHPSVPNGIKGDMPAHGTAHAAG